MVCYLLESTLNPAHWWKPTRGAIWMRMGSGFWRTDLWIHGLDKSNQGYLSHNKISAHPMFINKTGMQKQI